MAMRRWNRSHRVSSNLVYRIVVAEWPLGRGCEELDMADMKIPVQDKIAQTWLEQRTAKQESMRLHADVGLPLKSRFDERGCKLRL